MNIFMNQYSHAMATEIQHKTTKLLDDTYTTNPKDIPKPVTKWYYTLLRSLVSCFTQSNTQFQKYSSNDAMDNSLHNYINNIFTTSEIDKIISKLPEYNTAYIPHTHTINRLH
jgi:hypothetical protein